MKYGLVDYKNMIGAEAKIISYSLYDRDPFVDSSEIHRISEVKFRITIDGKVYPIFYLEKYGDVPFKPENLEIVNICENTKIE